MQKCDTDEESGGIELGEIESHRLISAGLRDKERLVQ